MLMEQQTLQETLTESHWGALTSATLHHNMSYQPPNSCILLTFSFYWREEIDGAMRKRGSQIFLPIEEIALLKFSEAEVHNHNEL